MTPTPSDIWWPTEQVPSELSLQPGFEHWVRFFSRGYKYLRFEGDEWEYLGIEDAIDKIGHLGPILLHRSIAGCFINLEPGRGLPGGWYRRDEDRPLGDGIFYRRLIYDESGTLRFIVYSEYGVHFSSNIDQCVLRAEEVLDSHRVILRVTPTP